MGSDAPERRVFIDSTWSRVSGHKTGIPRVVRNLCRCCGGVGRGLGLDCAPAVFDGARFQAVRAADGPDRRAVLRHALLFARERLGGVLQAVFPSGRGAARTYIRVWGRVLLSRPAWPYGDGRIDWRPGDVLILADASWNLDFEPALVEARAAGARVVALIHDLIPLTHPHFCGAGHVRLFDDWFRRLCAQADAFVAVSGAVRASVEERLGGRAAPITVFPLGCNFRAPGGNGEVRFELERAFAPGPGGTYLTVGTLEPRKNHAALLDAFDAVWRTHPEARLCIVGAKGPGAAAVVRRVRRHPLFGRRLFLFHDLSDAELGAAYERARAVVLPSLAEGFGLPVVEALRHGAAVFVNDMPVFREVGGGHCTYFDATRPESLARLIAQSESGELPPAAPADAGAFKGVDWDESCRELLLRAVGI